MTRGALETLYLARTLVDQRWGKSTPAGGEWVAGDPTGWRRKFDLGAAIVYAAYWLRVPDSERHVAERVLLDLTCESRHAAWRKGEVEPGLGWWSDQQPNRTYVLKVLTLAIEKLDRERLRLV